MGFVIDQDGIINRYAREKAGWDIHLDNCKKAILQAIDLHKSKNVTILGSGWLLDVPLKEITERCDHVFLHDIVHPKLIQHKASKFNNVTLVESDITGGLIDEVHRVSKLNFQCFPVDSISVPSFKTDHQSDLIISLNILNQLDILICDFIVNNFNVDDKSLIDFRKSIQQSHINSLINNRFCLITDFEEEIENISSGEKSVRPLVLVPMPVSEHESSWTWKFDSTGNYIENSKVIFNVKAIY